MINTQQFTSSHWWLTGLTCVGSKEVIALKIRHKKGATDSIPEPAAPFRFFLNKFKTNNYTTNN